MAPLGPDVVFVRAASSLFIAIDVLAFPLVKRALKDHEATLARELLADVRRRCTPDSVMMNHHLQVLTGKLLEQEDLEASEREALIDYARRL